MITKNTIKPFALAIIMAAFAACEPEIEREFPANPGGDADFSTYVALGNSLTAGFADNRLNRAGQLYSYPAIIADKMAAVVPDFTFVQPLLPEGTVDGTLLFKGLANGAPVIEASTGGVSSEEAFRPVSGTFNNLGIPGARVADLTRTELISQDATFFFNRFQKTGQTPIQMAAALNPTFFTMWIGANDVLGYATEGGESNYITEPDAFRTSFLAAIAALKQANPNIEGAIANIPNVNDIAYFNTVPWNRFVLTAEQAALLNAGLKAQIEPGVRDAVTTAVITSVVTEKALKEQIIPAVARAIVKAQIAASTPCNATTDPSACAETIIQSGAANTQINDLKNALILNYFKPVNQRDQQYAQAYAIIDQQKLANQAAINASIQQTIAAYKANQLPADQQAALKQAIDVNTQGQLQQFKAAGFYPVLTAGPNGFIVAAEQSPTGIKQLTSSEKITLQALSAGVLTPEGLAAINYVIPDRLALDAFELKMIDDATAAYNSIIAEIAAANTFALVDIRAVQERVNKQGIQDGGRTFTASFITGGLFSLDGVHLTPAGYALIAKEFIQKINSYYEASLPLPEVSRYPTIALPTGN